MTMGYIKLIAMVSCALTMFSCEKHGETELYDNSPAVDLSEILDACKWFQGSDDENKDIKLIAKISPDLPEQGFYLFEDTAKALECYAKAAEMGNDHASAKYSLLMAMLNGQSSTT